MAVWIGKVVISPTMFCTANEASLAVMLLPSQGPVVEDRSDIARRRRIRAEGDQQNRALQDKRGIRPAGLAVVGGVAHAGKTGGQRVQLKKW